MKYFFVKFTMINTTKFSKRLHRILDYYDLSASSFADGMNVGRSSISHILSGRNKPSLDFVMKVVSSYPEVDLYWLLNGKGDFPKQQDAGAQKDFMSAPIPEISSPPKKQSDPSKIIDTPEKRIKKIVLFYNDGTFEAFDQ